MYATAFRCGHPKCRKPLYRMNDVSGELTLNSTVAHIHARREGGPRWSPGMSGEDNRSEANLVLLCLEHSREVDDAPGDYPADEMRSWKQTVRAEYDQFQQSWTLNEDQVAEVFAASFEVREFARTTVESESLTQAQRLGGALIEEAKRVRRPAQAIAAAWVALCDRYTMQTRAWDENGELLRVYPPGIEKQEFERKMIAALTAAQTELEPRVNALTAELRALRSTNVELGEWCDWVELEARRVLATSITASLEKAAPAETQGLSDALDALAAAWRGDAGEKPPVLVETSGEPARDPAAEARAIHRAILNQASPWSRVTTRKYDAELYDQVVDQMPYAASMPQVFSNLGIDLIGAVGLAAAIARNATEEVFKQRIEEAARLEPLAVAIALLDNLATVAEETARTDLQGLAVALSDTRLLAETWSDADAWETNVFYARRLLNRTASRSDEQTVEGLIQTGISSADPSVVLAMLADWRESLGMWSTSAEGELHPVISTIPGWLPEETVRGMVSDRWPDLESADLGSTDVERRLAAELLKLLDSPE